MTSENTQFYKTLLTLAVPVTIQNTITSSLNLVDTIMIGQLGEVEVAAVGLANRWYFVLILLLFAIGSGSAIFTAQYWGKRDVGHIGKVMGIALALGLVIAGCFSLGALLFPAGIMRVFTTDPLVIAEGRAYLGIVAFSFLLSAITMVYSFVLRSVEQVKLPMYASTTALALNTVLNYCLILGHFGFPALGVRGAAIATLIARIVEASIILVVTYWKRYPVVYPRDFLSIPLGLIKQFFVTTSPVIANELSWVLGMTSYSIVYGRMGTSEIAAMNMVNPVEQISSSIFFGLASAASVMIGNQIGAGREDRASAYAKKFSILAPTGALFGGAAIMLTASHIVSVFQVAPTVRAFALNSLYVLSAVLWIRIFNMIAVVGILRGGGDTKFSMYLEMGSIWLIGVPLALLGGFVLQLPVYLVFALINVEEFCKMVAGIFRVRSGKWIHNLVGAPGVTEEERYEKLQV